MVRQQLVSLTVEVVVMTTGRKVSTHETESLIRELLSSKEKTLMQIISVGDAKILKEWIYQDPSWERCVNDTGSDLFNKETE